MKYKKILDGLFKLKKGLLNNIVGIVFWFMMMSILFVSLQMNHSKWDNFQIITWSFLLIILMYIAFFNIYFRLEGIFMWVATYFLMHLILGYYNINLPFLIIQFLMVIAIAGSFIYNFLEHSSRWFKK